MAIKVQWDNEAKTVIRYDFSGKWNWDEFEAAAEQSFTMTESVRHEVHVIMHLTGKTPMIDGAVVYFRRKLAALPYNRGMIVIAGGDKSIKLTFEMFSRIHKRIAHRLALANDLKAAREMVAHSLPDIRLALNNSVFVEA